MAKKTDKEVQKLLAANAKLQEKNRDLATALTQARQLLEQGQAIVSDLEAKLDAADYAANEAEAQASLAQEREQNAKLRTSAAEKVAQRLWKALGLLDDRLDDKGKLKPRDPKEALAEAQAFRDQHVQPNEQGILVLISE